MSNRRKSGRADQAARLEKAGRALWQRGNLEAALGKFKKAVKFDPSHKSAWNSLGAVLMSLDRGKEALACFRRALKIDPNYSYALINFGRYHLAMGTLDHAEAALSRAVRGDPNPVAALFNLAQVHRRKHEPGKAETMLRRVVQMEPGHLDAWLVLAGVLAEQGSWKEASRCYGQALTVEPGNLVAQSRLSLGLPKIYRDSQEVDRARTRYREGLETLVTGLDVSMGRPAEEKLRAARQSNFLLAYQGLNDLELQQMFSGYQRALLESVLPRFYDPMENTFEPGRKLRVGFVSEHFCLCTVGKYFRSWVTDIDPDDFETVVFSIGVRSDELNREIREACHEYHELTGSLAACAGAINEARLDVLIYPELGMNKLVFALANMRLAPLQCCAWGHPVTSGHDNIDWFISPADMEPDGAEAHYGERLVTLPGIGTSYARPEVPDKVTRQSLGLPEEGILYLFPQSLFKIHPDNDPVLAEILAREPRARLVLFESRHVTITRQFSRRLSATLEARGISTPERITFLPRASHDVYLQVNEACDVMLDSVRWSGGNTALDALACGLPVITLPGEFMRGRQTMVMLKALDLGELVASSREDYVTIALALGRDAQRRKQLRAAIAERNAVLFDQDGPIRALETLLRAGAPRNTRSRNVFAGIRPK